MNTKYLLSVILYITAWMCGANYLYLALVIFAFLYKDIWIQKVKNLDIKKVLLWGLSGGIFAGTIQAVWALIQKDLFHIIPQSIHTNYLISSARTAPGMIILICVVCPILEEIIFRKIIFDSLKGITGMYASIIISAFLFALIHLDFANIIRYMLIGFVFSLIYIKSKNLFHSMAAHMVMNTIVLIILI